MIRIFYSLDLLHSCVILARALPSSPQCRFVRATRCSSACEWQPSRPPFSSFPAAAFLLSSSILLLSFNFLRVHNTSFFAHPHSPPLPFRRCPSPLSSPPSPSNSYQSFESRGFSDFDDFSRPLQVPPSRCDFNTRFQYRNGRCTRVTSPSLEHLQLLTCFGSASLGGSWSRSPRVTRSGQGSVGISRVCGV